MTAPPPPRTTGPACRLTLTVADGARWKRQPLFAEILFRARRAGLDTAAVYAAVEGLGRDGTIRTTRLLSFSDGRPLMIVLIGDRPGIAEFVESLDPLMEIDSMVIDHVQRVVAGGPLPAPDTADRV